MNRSELVQNIAEHTGLNRTTADQAVDAFIESVMAATKAGDKVALFGFGTFNPTQRAARTGRNPRTGEPVKIAASKGVRFSPAAAFKTVLNGKKSSASSAKPKARKPVAKKPTAKKTAVKKKASPAKKSAAKPRTAVKKSARKR